MPSTSKKQQTLFRMALAVRRGDLEHNEVNKEVLDIVKGDMTDKEIEDFANNLEEGSSYPALREFINEQLNIDTKEFIVIKPGFEKLAGTIIELFKNNGFEIVQMRPHLLTLQEAKGLYRAHKKEEFYKKLCEYMSSGISIGIIFERKRRRRGLSKSAKTLKKEIRNKYGESDLRNVIHSADTVEDMMRESTYYFYSI